MTISDAFTDLVADGDEVDAMVANLDAAQWKLPTPAVGWTVAHQIAHLAATFRLAATAASNPAEFKAILERMSDNFSANVEAAMSQYLVDPPEVLLSRWRAERAAAEKALVAVPDGELVPWLVRPIPAATLAAAGMMELFGHGQDIADALGIRRQYTDRVGHLVWFGHRVWDFGYIARGLPVPEVQFRFEITAPSGKVWEFGPADSPERITGPAVDFCLLITRRRHRADLALKAQGAEAERWLDLAQAYRGPAGPGRQPGQFRD